MVRIALFLSCLLVAGVAAADPSIRLGGSVEVNEKVEGDLQAAGGSITISAPVAGSAALAGGSITVKDAVDGNLRAAGGHVLIDAPVGGNASVAAGTLELGPNARIAGKVSFTGGELKQDAAAQVVGPVEQNASRWRHRVDRHIERHVDRGPFDRYTRGWFWTTGLVVLAALIAAALPGPSKRLSQELTERPWITTLVGFLALASIPVVAVLAMITIVGIPLGVLAIIAYAALLLVGYVWLAVVVGGLLLDRVKPEVATETVWRAGAAVLAMLTLALFARLPYVGGVIGFVALVVGVGMIVAAVMRRRGEAREFQAA